MAPSSSDLVSAVRHPLRRRILHAFLDGPAECASAGELADALDQRVAQVAYHLRTLGNCEILRLVRRSDRGPEYPQYGWTLGVEPDWLRLVLQVWTEPDVTQ